MDKLIHGKKNSYNKNWFYDFKNLSVLIFILFLIKIVLNSLIA